MSIGSTEDGVPIIASARDVGNYVAGYVAGKNGLSWYDTRCGFDLYQSWQSGAFVQEGESSQLAQKEGWKVGRSEMRIEGWIYYWLNSRKNNPILL